MIKKVRVLIVDDSAIARSMIRDVLERDPHIEVVGLASDPYIARDLILELDPDVITLDMEMPRMDGLSFLKILQEHHPIPVVVISALTPAGSQLALAALAAGAIDVVKKPDTAEAVAQTARRLITQIKAAAQSRRITQPLPADPSSRSLPDAWRQASTAERLILLGGSTGGVEALRFLLPRLPPGLPPMVVVQHIPPVFSRAMAEHLNRLTDYEVREAVDGDRLEVGLCLIAPGGFHTTIVRQGSACTLKVFTAPAVNHCRPSVDVLFRSAAEQVGRGVVAALLTGMGRDGAHGMQLLHAVGAKTLAQSEDSCVVFGMPQAAIELGGVQRVVSLTEMPYALLEALEGTD